LKPNTQNFKTPIPEQPADERNKNFEEVALGYTPEMAVNEARRCLNCRHMPCVAGCPVQVRIPQFILKIASEDFSGAFEEITKTNELPAICGRVCPQETQCEERCVRGIKGEPVAIGRLERFAADWNMKNAEKRKNGRKFSPNGHRVAVVGSGPASLTCAGDLAKMGYEVTMFEAFSTPGGVLVYGIPEFRLPKAVVAEEIENLRNLGVEIRLNMVVGRIKSVDELFADGYEAVFLGTGAGLPMFMNIPGENLLGVYSANEYLTRINLMKAYREDYDTPVAKSRRVVVVGGGNVAMDAARSAKRLGADVTIVYRRSEKELPARAEEVHHAKEEGIEFRMLTNPVAIHGDETGRVNSIECLEMTLGEPDSSGRRRPEEKPGSNFIVEADTAIIAIGTSPNPLIRSTTDGLETNSKGCIITDESGHTSREGVFAGGDAVTGAATVILAMGAGKTAACAIDAYIKAKAKN
jgi:glutamate synthase (NADPH/NADH) small chain